MVSRLILAGPFIGSIALLQAPKKSGTSADLAWFITMDTGAVRVLVSTLRHGRLMRCRWV